MRASGGASASASADGGAADILCTLFGVEREVFLRRFGGRRHVCRHGPRRRFLSLLGEALVPDMRALAKLALPYGRDLGAIIYDDRGVLGMRGLGRRERARIGKPGGIYFFRKYDERFDEVRRFRKSLCDALGSRPSGARISATLQNRNALLPRHCDRTDVFILQLFGNRRWRLQQNSDPPTGLHALVRTPRRMRKGWSADFEGRSPVVTLKPGSALYVPRGCWHETQSSGPSLALVITLSPLKKRRR